LQAGYGPPLRLAVAFGSLYLYEIGINPEGPKDLHEVLLAVGKQLVVPFIAEIMQSDGHELGGAYAYYRPKPQQSVRKPAKRGQTDEMLVRAQHLVPALFDR